MRKPLLKIKKLLAVLATVSIGSAAMAQTVAISAYNFTQFQGTYTAISGGTVFGTSSSDDGYWTNQANPTSNVQTGPGISIGFNFTFGGVVYDRFGINNNGWISFGQSTLTPNPVNMNNNSGWLWGISGTSTAPPNLQRRVAALSCDLNANGGNIRVETIGTAPSRTCVIQWANFSTLSYGGVLNFQIRLDEGTNIISVVYNFTTPPNNYGAEVGLRGTTNADYNNRVVLSSGGNWATSTAGTANNATCWMTSVIAPTSGQTYQWYHTIPCTNSIQTPTISTAATPDNTLCLHAGETVNFDANFGAGPPYTGVDYQWMESSSSGGPFSPVSGGTPGVFGAYQTDGLGANPVYYMLEATCISEAVTVNSNIFSVFPNPTVALVSAPVINTNASPIVVCSNETYTVTASGAFTYTWTNGPNSLINNVYVVNPANGYPEYGVEAESIDGCFGETAFSLQIKDAPIVTAVAFTNNVCQGGNVTLFTFGNAVTYTWSANANSSNAPVIVVTPAQSGLYVVSATAANGCMTSSSQSITVHTPANITATTPKPNGICAGETVNLTAQGAVTYTWNSNSGIFAGSSIEVSPEITTNYMITATDANGCISLGNIQQKVDACVGITELGAVSDELSVYPNPANSQITVELNNGAEKTVELFDLTGRVVLSGTTNNDKINLNIESLQNGVYFVKVKSNNTVEVIKIVKQ
ncbi:MAG: T9SS type A sorting domain-containing protein [Bacteroidetes bacterium]|nr:T9SS type A sorting domain-containing protein [Bacteroidota bacterium]